MNGCEQLMCCHCFLRIWKLQKGLRHQIGKKKKKLSLIGLVSRAPCFFVGVGRAHSSSFYPESMRTNTCTCHLSLYPCTIFYLYTSLAYFHLHFLTFCKLTGTGQLAFATETQVNCLPFLHTYAHIAQV